MPVVPPTRAEMIAKWGMPDDCARYGETTNNERIGWAEAALVEYNEQAGPGYPLPDYIERECDAADRADCVLEIGGDLISCLYHWAQRNGVDPVLLHERAMGHFVEEAGLGYEDEPWDDEDDD